PTGAGDVEMDPGDRADELLKELGRGDRASPSSADVLQVGDVAFEQFLEVVVHGQGPDALAGSLARLAHVPAELLVVGEEAGDLGSQGDDAGPGQRGEVEDSGGGGLGGEAQ